MRILIIKPSSFGDIIHGLVVAGKIKEQLPEARIDWVARDIFAGLVEASALANRVYRFHRSPRGFWKVCREIRGDAYDVVIDMQGLARSGFMTFAARAKIKIGRFDAREGSRFFYKVKTPMPRGPRPFHAVEILRQFQRPLGLYDLEPSKLDFPESPEVTDGPPPGSILLFPESRRPEKEWPHFFALAERLAERYPGRPISWLGTGENELGAGKEIPETLVDHRGKIPMASLPSVIREASIIVANDSGPMHLAAAMEKPVVAVFGPTDPAQYGPYPSSRPTNVSIRGERGDLAKVTVESVQEAISAFL